MKVIAKIIGMKLFQFILAAAKSLHGLDGAPAFSSRKSIARLF
jgi:hypothetical protein